MNVAQHIPEDDLVLFALALMQPEEAAYAAADLKHCNVCRGEVARLQGDLVTYAMTAEAQAPPPEARERLLRGVAKERRYFAPQPVAEPSAAASDALPFRRGQYDEAPRSGLGTLGWAGWALAAGLAAMSGWQFYQGMDMRRQISAQSAALDHVQEAPSGDTARAREMLRTLTDPTAMQVALRVPSKTASTAKPEGHAAYVAPTGDLIFVATHLHTIREDKIYELWLLPASGDPIPAGLFRPDANGNASVVLPSLPKNIPAKGFGVTVEEEGGSSKPTLPIVLAGT